MTGVEQPGPHQRRNVTDASAAGTDRMYPIQRGRPALRNGSRTATDAEATALCLRREHGTNGPAHATYHVSASELLFTHSNRVR